MFRAFGGHGVSSWYEPENAQHVVAMLIVPLAEEPGWRGFALPRLEARLPRVAASLALGLVWAGWHVGMFVLQAMPPFTFAIAMVDIVAGSIVFGWLYHRTRGSLLVAVLAHAGAHLNNPSRVAATDPTPLLVFTVATCLVAALLVALDREWRAGVSGHATRETAAAPEAGDRSVACGPADV